MKRTIINLNGDDASTLLAQLKQAQEALKDAIDRFEHLSYHGRNYQCNEQPELDLRTDIGDWQNQQKNLRSVRNYLMQSYKHVWDQVPDSKREATLRRVEDLVG